MAASPAELTASDIPGSLAGLLGSFAPESIAGIVGVEHEYRVTIGGERVDFRDVIHSIRWDGLRIDPADTNAYRLHSGLALTADDEEAEIASPPVAVAPGFGDELCSWVAEGRRALKEKLPP